MQKDMNIFIPLIHFGEVNLFILRIKIINRFVSFTNVFLIVSKFSVSILLFMYYVFISI